MKEITPEEGMAYFEHRLRELAKRHGVKIKIFDPDLEFLDMRGGNQGALVADLTLEFGEGPWGNA